MKSSIIFRLDINISDRLLPNRFTSSRDKDNTSFSSLIKIIQDIITDQKEINQMIDGGVISLDDYLFKAVERGLLLATPIDREIKRICKAAGIEPFTMNALRATFATRAIESGMNPKTLQEIMGHSNFNITMSLYGHCLLILNSRKWLL